MEHRNMRGERFPCCWTCCKQSAVTCCDPTCAMRTFIWLSPCPPRARARRFGNGSQNTAHAHGGGLQLTACHQRWAVSCFSSEAILKSRAPGQHRPTARPGTHVSFGKAVRGPPASGTLLVRACPPAAAQVARCPSQVPRPVALTPPASLPRWSPALDIKKLRVRAFSVSGFSSPFLLRAAGTTENFPCCSNPLLPWIFNRSVSRATDRS